MDLNTKLSQKNSKVASIEGRKGAEKKIDAINIKVIKTQDSPKTKIKKYYKSKNSCFLGD